MPQNNIKNGSNASTSDVNINMECEVEALPEHNPTLLNEPKPPLINIISSDGTSRCISKNDCLGQELMRPTPKPRQKIPTASSSRRGSYNVTPEQISIELPPLHTRGSSISENTLKAKNEKRSISGTSEASNENINLSNRDASFVSEYYTPTAPGSFFLTPNVQSALHRSLTSQITSAVPSYRTALDVTPPLDYIPDGQERSPSRIINSIWSRVRHPFGRHAMLEIMSPTRSSPSRSIYLEPSCSDHCLLGSSLMITGTIIFLISILCLALVDNTVPDHENGILYPIYESLYALKGQSRPINSFHHITIEDANIGVIPIHPSGIQDYSETHLNTEHGPYNMFDNDISTHWNPVFKERSSHFSYPSQYSLTVDLKNNYTMTAVRIQDYGNYKNDVTDFLLEVKRYGVWRLVVRYPTLPPGHKLKEINGFAVWGSVWKFTVLGTASGREPLIKELQFFGFKDH